MPLCVSCLIDLSSHRLIDPVGFGSSTFSEVDSQPYECRGIIKTHPRYVEDLRDLGRTGVARQTRDRKQMRMKRENKTAESPSSLLPGSHLGVLNDRVECIKVSTQLVLPSDLVFEKFRRYALSSLRLRPDPDRRVVTYQA